MSLIGGGLRLAGNIFKLSPLDALIGLGVAGLTLPGQRESAAIESRRANDPSNFGAFEISPLDQAIMAIGGKSADTALNKYKKQEQQRIANDQIVSALVGDIMTADPNFKGVPEGKSKQQVLGMLAPKAEEARLQTASKRRKQQQRDDYGSLQSQYDRAQTALANRRLDDARRSELELRRDTLMGEQRLAEQRLFDARENFADKMDFYQYQVQSKADLDRYKTTAGLIQGLGALGMAFTL